MLVGSQYEHLVHVRLYKICQAVFEELTMELEYKVVNKSICEMLTIHLNCY